LSKVEQRRTNRTELGTEWDVFMTSPVAETGTHCEATMIGWALTFLLVALVAAVFGFGGIAGTAVEIAKLIFFVAIVLFAISAVVGLLRGRSPTI
jgi:uncharacterized membrane protein YtjA (UPF0391 family)